jgi:hypothetical protein
MPQKRNSDATIVAIGKKFIPEQDSGPNRRISKKPHLVSLLYGWERYPIALEILWI